MALNYTLINPEQNSKILYSLQQKPPFQQLALSIKREKDNAVITFSGKKDIPSATNYYFAICFEAGFLVAPRKLINISLAGERKGTTPSWLFTYEKNRADGSDCFYLLPANTANIRFDNDQKEYNFIISGINMPDGLGPMNIRSELKYNNFSIGKRPPSGLLTKEYLFNVIPDISGLKNDSLPFQARPLKRWNFLQGGDSKNELKQSFDIEVSINPDFQKWHLTPDDPDILEDFELKFLEGTTISLESSSNQVEIVSVEAENWYAPKESTFTLVANNSTIADANSAGVTKNNPLIIKTELKTTNLLSQNYLVIIFEKVYNPSTGKFIPAFDLHIPLYVGPLRVEKDLLTIGDEASPTNFTTNGLITADSLSVGRNGGTSIGIEVDGRIHSKGRYGGLWVDSPGEDKGLLIGRSTKDEDDDKKLGLYNKTKDLPEGYNGWGLTLDAVGKVDIPGELSVANTITAGSLSVANTITAGSLSIANAITTDSLSVANAITADSLSVANTITAGSLSVGGNGETSTGIQVDGRIHSKGRYGGLWVDSRDGDKGLLIGRSTQDKDDNKKLGLYNNTKGLASKNRRWGLTLDGDGKVDIPGSLSIDGTTINASGINTPGSLTVNGATTTKSLIVNGEIKINGEAPFIFQNYQLKPDDNGKISHTTEFDSNKYLLCIVGLNIKPTKAQLYRGINIMPKTEVGGTWNIKGEIYEASVKFLNIQVLAIRQELVHVKGFFTP